jgi:hypothetical protein
MDFLPLRGNDFGLLLLLIRNSLAVKLLIQSLPAKQAPTSKLFTVTSKLDETRQNLLQ